MYHAQHKYVIAQRTQNESIPLYINVFSGLIMDNALADTMQGRLHEYFCLYK